MKRIYNTNIQCAWSETKRRLNLKDHGLDFFDAIAVFEGATISHEIRLISFRKATRREARIFFAGFQE